MEISVCGRERVKVSKIISQYPMQDPFSNTTAHHITSPCVFNFTHATVVNVLGDTELYIMLSRVVCYSHVGMLPIEIPIQILPTLFHQCCNRFTRSHMNIHIKPLAVKSSQFFYPKFIEFAAYLELN